MSKQSQMPQRSERPCPDEVARAWIMHRNGHPDEALRALSIFLDDHMDDVHAIAVAAHIMIDAKRYGMAFQLLHRGVMLDRESAVLWNNLGFCAMKGPKPEEAEQYLFRALKCDPNDASAMSNLALLYFNLGDAKKALPIYERASAIDPDSVESKYGIGECNLALGNWRAGWQGYEHNLGAGRPRSERLYKDAPVWDGSKDKTIIAYGEQGLGDEISFASCLPDLIRDNSVIIECDPKLVGIFRRSFNVPVYGTRFHEGITWPKKHKPDASIAFGSLPKFFRNEVADFPARPYLVADPERRIQWRALLDSLGPKPKIGIAWTGGKRDTGTERRSLELLDLMPILRQDATFISLQYKPAPEIDYLEKTHGIKVHHWPHALHTADYDDTAALVSELDLVVSVTTAAIHLCGALGKPCWVMVPKAPMWRYGVAADRMPWYGSVRLYRQKSQWVETIAEVAADLRDYVQPKIRSVH